jgi:hypothetical protein
MLDEKGVSHMSVSESKSEVASLMQRIDLEREAAQQGLTGLAYGTARHDFITARMERGAERILLLIQEGKLAEAIALMETETWSVDGEEELR